MNMAEEKEGKETQKDILVYPKERISVQLTQEQLELLLQNYEKELRKIDWRGFIEIVALFIAIFITIMTASFGDFLGFSGETIRGFFILAASVSGGFSAYLLIRNIYYSCVKRPQSAHDLIEKKVNEMRVRREEIGKEEYSRLRSGIYEWRGEGIRKRPGTGITGRKPGTGITGRKHIK